MLEKIRGERNSEGEITTLYRCQETGELFGRVLGGISWPKITEAFVAVMGEELNGQRGGGEDRS